MTAQDLITRALTLCGRLGAGRTPSTTESNVSLPVLQALVDNMNQQRCYLSALDTITAAVSGAETSLGTRPVHIEQADFTSTAGSLTSSLAIGLNEYNAVPQKFDVTPLPRALYCDYGSPTAKVYIAPTPVAGALRLKVWSQISAASFATLATSVTLPPGVERALVDALAVELCGLFGLPVSGMLAAAATDSRAALARLNLSHGSAHAQASSLETSPA